MNVRACAAVGVAAVLFGCSDGRSPTPPPPPPPPDSGLDARPVNTACLAPERDPTVAGVTLPRAFPRLAFAAPVALEQAPGDGSRWFVVEQAGHIRVFDDDPAAAAAADFIDLSERVRAGGDAGLLGIAFHPDFATNGRAYVSYVAAAGGTLRAVTSEFTSPDGGLTLDPQSERVLITVAGVSSSRIGGKLDFGWDGYLYIGLGDGGGSRPGRKAQDPRSLLGKMLRIDVDASAAGSPYAIPVGARGNPFAGHPTCHAGGTGAQECPEIYALGLRDPRGWSFDRRTGELWLGDAGEPSGEINLIERGGNYGWDADDAAPCRAPMGGCAAAGLTAPVAKVERGAGAPVTGGLVYRGKRSRSLAGRYVFGDAGGRVAMLAPDRSGGYVVTPLAEAGAMPEPLQISAFGEDEAGELYVLDRRSGYIHRLAVTTDAAGDNVPELLSETGCISADGPGAPPLASLIPFKPNAVLWSDGAAKDRWIALPAGQNIGVQDDGDWDLPNGSVLVKHFRLHDRLIETRLFMRHPDGEWAGYTFHWNDDETEATRVEGGLTVDVEGQQYSIPSEAECMFCHNGAAGFSLGPETAQLNGPHLYPQTGRTANQITPLNAIAVLTPPVGADPPAYVDHSVASESLDARARAYLHINCSICHRPGGPTPALIDLRHDTPLPETNACNALPTRGDLGIPDARIIAPGESARSERLARMSRRDAAGMPPVATNLPDPAGVALITEWIDSLGTESCE